MGRRVDVGAVRISAARRARSVDIRARQSRYLMSMAIRTACFVLAVVTAGPLRWTFVVCAFVLPYIAVVGANAGRAKDPGGVQPFVPALRPALEPPPER